MTPKQRASIALVSVALLGFTAKWEGTETVAYADKLAYGLPTVCNGHTGPEVRVGDVWTKAQCDAILVKDIERHGSGLLDCVSVPLNQNQYDAFADWAFNIGIGAACKSTAIRLLNEGQYTAACNGLLNWNRANGQVVAGLTKRRTAERDLCIKPMSEPVKALA